MRISWQFCVLYIPLFDLVQQSWPYWLLTLGGSYQLSVLLKKYVCLQLLVQPVCNWECWTFYGANFSCWSVKSKSVKAQLCTDRQRRFDWLTANKWMWLVHWADIRGEECMTHLRTSAWEAIQHCDLKNIELKHTVTYTQEHCLWNQMKKLH